LPATTKRKVKSISFPTIALVALSLAVIGLGAAARPVPQENAVETCGTCHDVRAKAFPSELHAVLGDKGCTDCHGSGEKHIEEGTAAGIFAFSASDLVSQKTEKCLACHEKDNPRFMVSPHSKASLDCTTCHTIHGEQTAYPLLKARENKLCALCHEDVVSLFQLNERHRLQEGIVTCASCHDPHAPAARTRLGGFKQQECIQCHTDKGGPFLYEHQASRVEGCTICHEVHGSPNRHMLIFQNTADLCFSCHAQAPAWHANFSHEGTNCVTCHSAIHGSNLDKKFLK
jgi:DmsE family decaheme c-type cytochrome